MAIVGHWRPWGSCFGWVVRCRCLFAPMLGFPCLLLLWPVCAFGRLGRLAVSLFLVKGSARDLVSNDSVGPCWLKNCLTFKFGESSNLDIDSTSERSQRKPRTSGHRYHCADPPPHIYCGRGSGAKVRPRRTFAGRVDQRWKHKCR